MATREDILGKVEALLDEDFTNRLEQLHDVPAMTIGEYFADMLKSGSGHEQAAVKRHANTTIHDFFLKVVTMRDRDAEEDFGWLEQISRAEGNAFDDLRDIYEVAATIPPSPPRAPAQVLFHLLDIDGANVELSIEVDAFKKVVELDSYLFVDGKRYLVQRIAYDHNRLDVFLWPTVLH